MVVVVVSACHSRVRRVQPDLARNVALDGGGLGEDTAVHLRWLWWWRCACFMHVCTRLASHMLPPMMEGVCVVWTCVCVCVCGGVFTWALCHTSVYRTGQ